MAKKMNLLLTLSLAVICLAALLLGLTLPLNATPAQAAEFEYVKSSAASFTISETPVVLVGKGTDNLYYAMTANGTSLKSTAVTIEGDKITSAITNDMLWIVEKNGYFYRQFKNVGQSKYLYCASKWSVSLNATASPFYNDLELMCNNPDDTYVYINQSTVATSTTTSTKYEVYVQTEKQTSATEKTITFNKGSENATGTMADAKWDTANGAYALPACTYTNQYYLFKGWKVGDSEEVKEAGETITLTEDITLTAVWEYNAWNITFKMDGKADVVKQVVKGNSYYMPNFTGIFSSSDVPDGQLFAKWQDADGNYYANGTNYTFDKDMQLTPVFANKVTISFDFNGGHANSSNPTSFPETKTYEYAAGSVQKITTYYNPEKTNYILTGWKCGDLVVKSGVEFTVADEDMRFVAQWRYDGIILTFNDGTNTSNVELTSGTTSYTIAVNDPAAPEGQKFLGWQIAGDESGTLYSKSGANKTITIAGDEMTLNAVYRNLKTYTVTLHYGETTKELQFTEDTQNIQFNSSTFTANEMGTIDGDHIFDGWYKEATFATQMSTSYLTADDSFENLHLYAKVSAYFHVLFDYGFKAAASDETNIIVDKRAVEGGTGVTALNKASGSDYHAKEKYTLVGWTTTEGGDVVYAANDRTFITTACTLYAVWDYDYYVITLTVNADEPINLTAEVLKSATKYTLGEVIASLSADDQAKLSIAHKTINWVCVDDDYRAIKLTDELAYKKDVEFSGTFVDVIYTITVTNMGGDNLVISGKYGDLVTAPDTTRAGYEFKGFKLNGQDYTFTTMPGENIEVYCQYEALDSTLTFDTGDGGSTIAAITAKSGSIVDKPADPTREGYVFVKWQMGGKDVAWLVKDGTSQNPEYYINMPGGGATLVAKWNLIAEGLAALKTAKLAELDAYITQKGVELPASYANAINSATDEDGVNAAYDAAVAKADEMAANIAEVNAAITALSGKKGAELFTAIKAVEAKLAALTEAELEQVDVSGYNAAKTAYEAYLTAAAADTEVAENMAAAAAAVKLATAVTAMAMLAFVLKRRMW